MEDIVAFEELNTAIDLDMYQKLKKDMEKNAIAVVSSRFKEIFETFPEVKAIGWTQYAPYFNDGDACVFSVHEICFKLNELEEKSDEDEDYDEDSDFYRYPESDIPYGDKTPVGLAEKELNNFADSFENVFQEAFGEHSLVVCTREGFDIREYAHD